MTVLHPDALETALDELTTFYPDWRTWPVETLAGCLAQAVNAARVRTAAGPGVCRECKRPGGGHEPWCAGQDYGSWLTPERAALLDAGTGGTGVRWPRPAHDGGAPGSPGR